MKRAIVVVLLAIAALALPATAAAAPARTNLFVAHLVGVQETPPNDSAAQGQVIMHVNADGSVSYKLIVANITNVTMAHIHVAPRGVPGPIKQWLYPEAGPPPMLRPGRTDGVLAEGMFMPTPALLAAIENGEAYVNVHTLQHPGGEIRGQLRASH
ncbi:MAG: CHRD domain-containing protein [Candidatus Dormibacter sp.]